EVGVSRPLSVYEPLMLSGVLLLKVLFQDEKNMVRSFSGFAWKRSRSAYSAPLAHDLRQGLFGFLARRVRFVRNVVRFGNGCDGIVERAGERPALPQDLTGRLPARDYFFPSLIPNSSAASARKRLSSSSLG